MSNIMYIYIYIYIYTSFLYSTRAISTAANSAYLVIDPKKNLQDHFNAPPCPPPPPIKSSSSLGETSRKDKVVTPTPPKKPPHFRIGASGDVVENTEGSGYDNDETSSMLLPIKPHSKTVPMEYEETGSKRTFKLPFIKRLNHFKAPPCPPPPPIKSSSLVGETSRKDKVVTTTPPKKPPRFRIGASGDVVENTEGSGYENDETSSMLLPIKPHSKTLPMEYEEPGSKKTFKLPFIKRLKTTPREHPNIEEEELVYDDIINALNTLPLSKTTPTEVPMTIPQSGNVSAVSEKEKKKKKLPMIPPRSNTTQRSPPESYQNLYTPTEFPGTTFEDVSVNSKGVGPPYYEFQIGPSFLSPSTQPPGSGDASKDSKKPEYYEFEIGPSALSPATQPPCSETTPIASPSKSFFKLPSIKRLHSKSTHTEKYGNVDEKKKEVGDKFPTYSNTKPSGDASKDSKKAAYYEFEVGPSALLPPTQPSCSETTPTEVPPSKSFFKLPKLLRSKSTSKEPTEKYENVNEEVVPAAKKLSKVPPKTTPPSGVDSKKEVGPMYHEIDVGPAALSTPIQLPYHNLPLTDGPGTTLPPPVLPRNKDKKKKPPKTPDTSLTDVPEAAPTSAVKKKETKKKKPMTPPCPKDPPTEAPGTSGSKDTPMYHEIDICPTAVPAPIQQYASSQTTITDGPDTRCTYASVKKTNKKPKTPPRPNTPVTEVWENTLPSVDVIVKAPPRPITPLREISETLTSAYALVKKEKPKTLPRPMTPFTEVSEDTSTSAVTKKKSKTLPHPKATPTDFPETTPTSVDMKGKPMTPPRPKNITMPRDMGVVLQKEEEDIYDDDVFQ